MNPTILQLVKTATVALLAKGKMERKEYYRTLCKQVHVKQVEKFEQQLEDTLDKFFQSQIKSVQKRLKNLGDLVTLEEGKEQVADEVVRHVFNPEQWNEKLVDAVFPIMARMMGEAAVAQLKISQVPINEEGKAVIYGIEKKDVIGEKVFCPTGQGGGVDPTCSPGGGSTGGMVGAKYDAKNKTWTVNGKALPAHIPKNIPPAWKDVKIATNPKADLLVKGKDAKGRTQSVYSETHTTRQAAKKFARINELRTKAKALQQEVQQDLKSSNPQIRENASVLALIQHTGLRPGGTGNTKAEKQAYGATTLEGRHIKVRGNKVTLEFTGKKGVDLKIPVTDPALKSMLKERKQEAGRNGKVFNTTDNALRAYTKTKDGGSFKPKDFRTARGTEVAIQTMKTMPKPTTQAEYKRQVKAVAKVVSQQLGNTPTVALTSYIDPTIFSAWRLK